MTKLRRGPLIALVGAAILALAVATPSASSAPTASSAPGASQAAGRTLTIGVQQGYNLLPVFAGLRNGYFKKAGITGIRFVVFASTPAMFAAAAQGQLDLGYQAIPGLIAYNRATSGTKLKIVAANTWDSSMFFARNGSGVVRATKANWQNAIRSLRGKKVGLPVPRGLQELWTTYLLGQVGMSPSDVTYTYVGVGPPAVAALKQGLVDTISGDALMLGLLAAEKLGYTFFSMPDGHGPKKLLGMPTGVFFAAEDVVAKDRQTFVAFARGLVQARAFLAKPANRRSVIDLMVRRVGLSQTEANAIYPVGIPVFAKAKMSRAIWEHTVTTLVDTGVIPGPAPSYADNVFDFAR
jgi:NitT/TauT family transport system substrate-binding protein